MPFVNSSALPYGSILFLNVMLIFHGFEQLIQEQ